VCVCVCLRNIVEIYVYDPLPSNQVRQYYIPKTSNVEHRLPSKKSTFQSFFLRSPKKNSVDLTQRGFFFFSFLLPFGEKKQNPALQIRPSPSPGFPLPPSAAGCPHLPSANPSRLIFFKARWWVICFLLLYIYFSAQKNTPRRKIPGPFLQRDIQKKKALFSFFLKRSLIHPTFFFSTPCDTRAVQGREGC